MFFKKNFKSHKKEIKQSTDKTMATMVVSDQDQTLIEEEDIYKELSKSIDLANKQKIEGAHKLAISSGMKVYKKGDKIQNRYEVHFIKQGAMGRVYLCYDHKIKEPVAIKTILPIHFKKNPSAKKTFKEEALTWVNLEKHNNIVTAKHVEDIDYIPVIFAEMIAGDENYGNDLSDYIKKGYKFSTEEALKLAVQFCDGMSFADKKFKEMGKVFVHRDIKPANLMMTRDRVLKITDFGLVKSEIEDKKWGGTPGYMSPEQFEGKYIDFRADIYSFGCIMYEMFCSGRRPYKLTEKELSDIHPEIQGRFLQRKHLKEEMTDPIHFIRESNVKNDIRHIIMKCLEKNRDNRFNNYSELRDVLENLYSKLTGEKIPVVMGEDLDVGELIDKGVSLDNLGKVEEAISCFDKVIDINPEFELAWANKGSSLAKLGKNEEAIECCDKALSINPNHEFAWGYKGGALSKIGKAEEAIECCDKALSINPESLMAWGNKGSAFGRLGKAEEAIKCFDKVLSVNPKDAKAWGNRGVSIGKLGMIEEAISCYDKAISINPEDAEAWYNKGNALGTMDKIKEAKECTRRAAKFGHSQAITNLKKLDQIPDQIVGEAFTWHDKGFVLLESGKYKEAIEFFDKALAINPKYAEAWNNKGFALNGLGKSEEVVECFNKAISIYPEFADAWFNKGNALHSLGQDNKAIECFNKAISIFPEDVKLWFNKGVVLCKLGKNKEAIECSEKAITLKPEFADAWYNKGVALYNSGKIEEGIQSLKKAAQLGNSQATASLKNLDPITDQTTEDAIIWFNKGINLGKSGMNEEALECFDKALEINPEDVDTWRNKGVSLNKLGKYEKAIECFDKALAINPEYSEAWGNKGSAFGLLGEVEEAIKCFDKVLAINPVDAEAWGNKGLSLGRLGKNEEAIECSDKAISINPEFANAWYTKGRALYTLGKTEEGIKSFKEAARLGSPTAIAVLKQFGLS